MTIQSPAPGTLLDAKGRFDLGTVGAAVRAFNDAGQLGEDPVAAVYAQRRAAWGLFTIGLRDEEMEAMRDYIFPYRELAADPSAKAPPAYNLVNGEWKNILWLSGDQTHQGRHVRLEPGRFSIQRVKLYHY